MPEPTVTPLTLTFERVLEPGEFPNTPSDQSSYLIRVEGTDVFQISPDDLDSPDGFARSPLRPGLLAILVSPRRASQLLTVTLTLPDGRSASVTFQHTGTSEAVAAPPESFRPLDTATAGFTFAIDEGVGTEDEAFIRLGIASSAVLLLKELGWSPPSPVAVTVISTGAKAGCCEAGPEFISFDTGNPFWALAEQQPIIGEDHHYTSAAHELVHVYQFDVGCVSLRPAPRPGQWFLEGMAEYLGSIALIQAGHVSAQTIADYKYFSTVNGGEAQAAPLEDQESGAVAYSVAYFAIEQLVSGRSITLFGDFCRAFAESADWPGSFQSAFGVSLDDFYDDFESYLSDLRS